uniref:Protein transport protein sec16 n=1 Tax=Davidia involucrata TaxID=16924 RepID=A0A5B7BHJ8_DAVIN
MASPPFQVEDQMDEDFFDKLVDEDDTSFTGSGTGFVENEDSDGVRAFSNLSIGEVSAAGVDSGSNISFGVSGENGCGDGVALASLDGHEDNLASKESNSFTPSNVIQPNDAVMGAEGGLDSKTNETIASSVTGVREVDWSSFNSDLHFHSGHGTGSYSDFFNELGDSSGDLYGNVGGSPGVALNNMDSVSEDTAGGLSSFTSLQHQEGQYYRAGVEQTSDGLDLGSSQYWENLYPGWTYDSHTGQWHQLEGYNATPNTQESFDTNAGPAADGIVTEQRSDLCYYQQTAQSVVDSVDKGCTVGSVPSWNQGSQRNVEYPAHMLFDPQYPGWYYDTIAQEWQLLESYTTVMNQPTSVDHIQQTQSGIVATGDFLPEKNHSVYDKFEQTKNVESQALTGQDQVVGWAGSVSDYNQNQQNMKMWQPEAVAKSEAINFTESKDHYGSSHHVNNFAVQQNQQMWLKPSGASTSFEQTSQSFDGTNGVIGFQGFVPAENLSQHHNQHKREPSQEIHFSPAYFDSKKSLNFSQQPLQSGNQFSSASNEGRSSDGHPPHALVTFGFGGKLIVMKDNSSFLTNSAYGSQDAAGGVINIHNLMEVVTGKTDASSIGLGAQGYFYTLCQQSFPGPLAGGNVGSRELNKWIDEKVANCESPDMDYRKGELLRLLFSLLKIACQYYGKLRSPFGADKSLKESDCPESAVAKLFASAKRNVSDYGALSRRLQNFPSEGQIQATALEVQKFLVSGRIKEALQCSQEGQLWGPALVLAAQLGDQFYGDTVKQMAVHQLVAGSPLRTLCLLIAGQPADVFSNTTNGSSLPDAVNFSQQPAQIGDSCTLDEWEENLAIITANRTKDDEFVVIHLGDCLWKEKGEVIAAHICYLVAEANFESHSDSARLCLIGADHWKYPRTYASPEAIQRTELFEYSKVLGNSQFVLLPFQPYKLIYAHMLAEVGKVSDSLKYCQAILKCLKTGRAPEVDTWKHLVSCLEERIRIHQQGGYTANLAPAKLVGKLLNLFDSTAHRVVGGLPPPVPSTSHSSAQQNGHDHQKVGPRVSNSQSTMAMSSLMPSSSMEPLSELTGGSNRMIMHNRSISEPDFGKTPGKVSPDTQEKASVSGGSSRFGRFGSQIFKKTMGLVLRSRPDRQAKLGEKNKFYYDEKLKRWVEEGAETPAEEAALPPPPTTAAFQSRMPDYNLKDGTKIENLNTDGVPENKSPNPSERNSGIPPIPPSSNQFSARGRMGVRARYVDTFNKGGGNPANLFQSPSITAAKPGGGSNAKFFVPTPVTSGDEAVQTSGESMQEAVVTNENPSTSIENVTFPSTPTSTSTSTSMTMHRFPSMDRIGVMANGKSSLAPHSRRTASWSGSFSDVSNPSKMAETRPLGEALGMLLSVHPSNVSSSMQYSVNDSSFGDDLHEVEL